jgi:hypothetical protein
MKYTTHKLPTADLDPNSASSGQKFGEAGQELALERGESVEALRNEQDSSQNELEQELLSHADGVTDEPDTSASAADHKEAVRASNRLAKTPGDADEAESKNPARSIDR